MIAKALAHFSIVDEDVQAGGPGSALLAYKISTGSLTNTTNILLMCGLNGLCSGEKKMISFICKI